MKPSNQGFSISVNDFTCLTSFTHKDHQSDYNTNEDNSTDDGSPKCRRIVDKSLYLAGTLVAVITRTLVVAGATLPVINPCANGV